MDPLSIVASVVGLLQAISTTYATFNTIRNLPKAFEHVRTYLPLAQRILKDVRAQLKQRNLTKAEQQSITRIIRECEIKATELKQIFDALEKKCKQDKDARSWDKLRGWYHEILRGIKGHRVESLMNDILEAMKKLALYQRFRLATQEDVAEIKKALEDISHVEPSLDDAAVESKTLIQATQIVNIGGMIQQNNPSGGMNTFNPVYNVSVDTVNLGSTQGSTQGFLHNLIRQCPTSYSKFNEEKEKLYPPSFKWILSDEYYRQWHQSQTSQLLWIRGEPGKGKTMILCGIIDKLQQESKNGMSHGWKPIYFFCQANDNQFNNATSLVRGLLESLFDEHRKLRDKMNRTDISYHLDLNSFDMLRNTLMKALEDPDLPGLYLIVDALDECQHELQDLKKLLQLIADVSNLSSVRIKVLVSSRPSEIIENELNPLQQKIVLSLESDQSSISESVQLYILHKVKELADKKRYDEALRHVVQQHLESNAQGTFLWVALVCKALEGIDVLARHTLQILEAKFPAGLENFYAKMMEDLNKSREDADVCKQILAIACVVYRPINWDEMVSLLGQPDLQGAKSIIASCGSFLTMQKQKDTEVISFVHQSAKEFLLENTIARRQILPFDVDHQHYRIFSISLQNLSRTLERDMYKLKDPGFHKSLVSPPKPDPLTEVRYSCVYWADHLLNLAPPGSQNLSAPEGKVEIKPLTDVHAQSPRWYIDLIRLIFKSLVTLAFLLYNLVSLSLPAREFHESMKNGGSVHEFLQDKYLYWLEALSLLSSIPEGVKAMERLEACSRNLESRELYSLINDARRFILSQKGAIEIAPLQVYVSALVFSPSGSLVKQLFNREEPKWICGKPKVGTVWDPCLQTLEGHDGGVASVVFSNDGQRLASGSHDNSVKIWDATSGDCSQTLEGHNGGVTSVVFSNDGQRLASSSHDETVKIWDTTSGRCLYTLKGHNSSVLSAVFSNNGQRLISCSNNMTVMIWDTTSGNCLQTFDNNDGWVSSVVFSNNGQRLASAFHDNSVKIWDTTSGDCLQTFEGHNGLVKSIVFSNNGQRLASGSLNEIVKIWDVASSKCLQTLEGHNSWVNSVVFSNDGQRLASGSSDKTVKIWDATSGRYLQTFEGHNEIVWSVVFSKNGQRLASGSHDKTVKIWDATSGDCPQSLEGHKYWVNSVVFSNDGQRLASGSNDTTIKIWDTTSGDCLQILEGHSHWVWSVIFSNNGQRLASGSEDKTIRIWDATSGNCLQTLEGHNDSVLSVVFSNNGQRLASCSGDTTVKIWNVTSSDCLQTLQGHGSSVLSVVFSNDGQRLASGSEDKTIRIWDATSGNCLHTLFVGTLVYQLSFDPKTNSRLSTELGTFDIPSGSGTAIFDSERAAPRDRSHSGYGISADGIWIVNEGQNLIWLPPKYRPRVFAVADSTVALASHSGCIYVMRFSPDVKDPENA